jgi:hypothetical protein
MNVDIESLNNKDMSEIVTVGAVYLSIGTISEKSRFQEIVT